MTIAEQVQEAQDRVLTQVETAQDQVLEMNRRMAEALAEMTAGVRSRVDVPALPFTDRLPDPKAMVEQGFDFAAKMMDANRQFYREMIDVWTIESDDAPAAKASSKSSSKSTAKGSSKARSTKKAKSTK